jgi:bifunctional UDP-N-acetylglucosamine pyrophosphorylase / glucosamine-1-phosphate N-acetyltransferase
VEDSAEASGVNDRAQLAVAEAELRRRTNLRLMAQGVTMLDPDRTYIDATVQIGPDCTIFPGSLLQGHTVIGRGCEIGPDTRLVDCHVGEGSVVEQTYASRAEIGSSAVVGPFAALGVGARVGDGVKTGPFFRAEAAS